MSKLFFYFLFLTSIILIFPDAASAQELVYYPINPSFVGGNPYNASWMFNEAQAQNTFTESSSASSSYSSDPLADFQQSLNRQILSQLSRQLVQSAFGGSALTEGHYELGDYIIDVSPSNEGIIVNILDSTNGSETNIVVPYY